MAIPDYQTLMLPILEIAGDGQEHKFRDAVEELAEKFSLSEEERNELLPSGSAVFNNRVGWARTYLKKAGLLESPKRGFFKISPKGKSLLAENPERIDNSTLDRYDDFQDFRSKKKSNNLKEESDQTTIEPSFSLNETPEDSLASAYRRFQANIESEMLETVMQVSPAFFERLVVDLLVKMGYGGNRQDAAQAVGQSGDGGIDGIINEDQLGLDVIYIQAKRWEGNIGRPEVQKFAGALQGQRAKKGVFITTSSFTTSAIDYVSIIDTKIILIDGKRLAKLMVDHSVGVSSVGVYEIKKIDSDYFEEG